MRWLMGRHEGGVGGRVGGREDGSEGGKKTDMKEVPRYAQRLRRGSQGESVRRYDTGTPEEGTWACNPAE